MIRRYIKTASVTASDDALLGTMLPDLVGLRMSHLTYQWVDGFVSRMKLRRNLAPGTIRKRVGALARVTDWHLRCSTVPGDMPSANALRLLPRGYSAYSRAETDMLAAAGKLAKRDRARDLRLPRDGELQVLNALRGEKRPERQRALVPDTSFEMLFQLILGTGMRLREAYTLRVDQVDLVRRIINVEGTKGHRGASKPRHVPLGVSVPGTTSLRDR